MPIQQILRSAFHLNVIQKHISFQKVHKNLYMLISEEGQLFGLMILKLINKAGNGNLLFEIWKIRRNSANHILIIDPIQGLHSHSFLTFPQMKLQFILIFSLLFQSQMIFHLYYQSSM